MRLKIIRADREVQLGNHMYRLSTNDLGDTMIQRTPLGLNDRPNWGNAVVTETYVGGGFSFDGAFCSNVHVGRPEYTEVCYLPLDQAVDLLSQQYDVVLEA